MKYIYTLIIAIAFNISWILPTNSAMNGGGFEIIADAFSFTGTQQISTGGDYTLTDTGGEYFATTTFGGTYELVSGFQSASRDQLSMTLDKSTVSLGTLEIGSVFTDDIVVTISSSDSGYTVSVTEDGDLRDGVKTIDDVSDGEVSNGLEEYGIKTIGGHGVLANDTAISNGLTVLTFSNETVNVDTTVRFRAAIGNSSLQGSYSHQVSFTLVANP